MVAAHQSRFTNEYELALAEYMAQDEGSTLGRAWELGRLARSLGVLPYEIVAVHAAALVNCAPKSGVREFTVAAEFLTQSLQAFEEELALQRRHSLKRAAHELRTPLTTLRLSLQVGLGRLEKGGTLEAPVLQKALVQTDKLAAKITELLSRSDDGSSDPPTPASP